MDWRLDKIIDLLTAMNTHLASLNARLVSVETKLASVAEVAKVSPKCWGCKGKGGWRYGDGAHDWEQCRDCRGTGRVS